jgi:hypothetical protein
VSQVLIPLSQAAIALKAPYRAVYDLAQSGRLGEPKRIGNSMCAPGRH